jgi:putative toxin-antitoxin system antitoxin component (TIGR02293 family)
MAGTASKSFGALSTAPGASDRSASDRSNDRPKDRRDPVHRRTPSDKFAWPGASLGLPHRNSADLIRAVKQGFPFRAIIDLAHASGVSLPDLASLSGISARTLARRQSSKRLSAEESERVLRFAMIFEKAATLFEGDFAEAREWLRQPKKALAGQSPLEYATTELGAREVENLIGRIEHGVFS